MSGFIVVDVDAQLEPAPAPRPYLCPRCGAVVGVVDREGRLHVYRVPSLPDLGTVAVITPHSRASVYCTCGGTVPWFRRPTA